MRDLSYQKFATTSPFYGTPGFSRLKLMQMLRLALRWRLRRNTDLVYLNRHLRRDAGIDELDLERMAIARAPLIR